MQSSLRHRMVQWFLACLHACMGKDRLEMSDGLYVHVRVTFEAEALEY